MLYKKKYLNRNRNKKLDAREDKRQYRNEVNEFSLPYYDKLKKIDLIHNSAEDASKFVNKNWNNILDWWYSDEVQSTIFEFSNNFSRYTPEPIKEINNFLEKEIEK